MSGKELAPPAPHKETAPRDLTKFWYLPAQHEIHEEKDMVIPLFYALKTATSRLLAGAHRTYFCNAQPFHDLLRLAYSVSINLKKGA